MDGENIRFRTKNGMAFRSPVVEGVAYFARKMDSPSFERIHRTYLKASNSIPPMHGSRSDRWMKRYGPFPALSINNRREGERSFLLAIFPLLVHGGSYAFRSEPILSPTAWIKHKSFEKKKKRKKRIFGTFKSIVDRHCRPRGGGSPISGTVA